MTEGLGRKELFSLLFLPFTIILQKKKKFKEWIGYFCGSQKDQRC